MQQDVTNLLKRDMDHYISNVCENVSLESYTSEMSISNEGDAGDVREKVKHIFQKFTTLMEKYIARFEKNRSRIDRNIKIYKDHPDSKVVLDANPKAVKLSSIATVAMAGAAVSIAKSLKSENSKSEIKAILTKTRENISQFKKTYNQSRGEKASARTVLCKDALKLAQEAIAANTKAAEGFKQAAKEISSSIKADTHEDLIIAGLIAHGVAYFAEQSGISGAKTIVAEDRIEINSEQYKLKLLKTKVEASIKKQQDRITKMAGYKVKGQDDYFEKAAAPYLKKVEELAKSLDSLQTRKDVRIARDQAAQLAREFRVTVEQTRKHWERDHERKAKGGKPAWQDVGYYLKWTESESKKKLIPKQKNDELQRVADSLNAKYNKDAEKYAAIFKKLKETIHNTEDQMALRKAIEEMEKNINDFRHRRRYYLDEMQNRQERFNDQNN